MGAMIEKKSDSLIFSFCIDFCYLFIIFYYFPSLPWKRFQVFIYLLTYIRFDQKISLTLSFNHRNQIGNLQFCLTLEFMKTKICPLAFVFVYGSKKWGKEYFEFIHCRLWGLFQEYCIISNFVETYRIIIADQIK